MKIIFLFKFFLKISLLLILCETISAEDSQVVNVCKSNCQLFLKNSETICTTRQLVESCYNTRITYFDRCLLQCSSLNYSICDKKKENCINNCNIIINQIFVTFCHTYKISDQFLCYEQMQLYSTMCFNQCITGIHL